MKELEKRMYFLVPLQYLYKKVHLWITKKFMIK
jgi:hypothetical protein